VPWAPSVPGELPTLGHYVIKWIAQTLSAPDKADYEPFVLYPEQEDFVLRFYELDPEMGKRKYRRAVISRARGWGKSPFLAAIACAEALADVVPDGWDSDGQPVGKPWCTVRTPLVQIAAVSETQTKNTWSPLLEMLQGPALDRYPGLEILDTFVNLPRGRIEPITSSARTVKGNRPVFAVLDQTEEWVQSNGGHRLAETMRINAAKIGGTTIESPNAYTPGEESVAEMSHQYWGEIREGTATDDGLYYDHREAPASTDIYDHESRHAGLVYAYGDSADVNGGHAPIDVLERTLQDRNIPTQKLRADLFNQITHSSDAWISQVEWAARYVDRVVEDRCPICIGFDGSAGRTKGTADATALIAVTMDNHYFELGVWEQPAGPAGRTWTAPGTEIEAAVRMAFSTYQVVGFFADPALWEDHVARWEAEYHAKLTAYATREHPIRFNTNRLTLVVSALEQFRSEIVNGEMTHSGESAMTRHFLNARLRKLGTAGYGIKKEHATSDRKIDAAYAALLAGLARRDAVAKGWGQTHTTHAPYLIQ
jgi:hypothetical protein